METLQEKFVEFLKGQRIAVLATEYEGKPASAPIAYANEGKVIYFATHEESNKAQNIMQNPKVAYSIFRDSGDWSKTKAVQVEGEATVLKDQKEAKKALRMISEKFPGIQDVPKVPRNLPLYLPNSP